MELEHREDHRDVEPQTTERSQSSPGQAALTTPFASEGLEQLRDSHC
ncbi:MULTISPECIES: hypothetical protein [Bradyrhizobium]|nr:hypothetical protein [Bradyrhizobium liaoningense]MBR0987824.1 hypothetical protein [Bradyrhizobium liaoningense]